MRRRTRRNPHEPGWTPKLIKLLTPGWAALGISVGVPGTSSPPPTPSVGATPGVTPGAVYRWPISPFNVTKIDAPSAPIGTLWMAPDATLISARIRVALSDDPEPYAIFDEAKLIGVPALIDVIHAAGAPRLMGRAPLVDVPLDGVIFIVGKGFYARVSQKTFKPVALVNTTWTVTSGPGMLASTVQKTQGDWALRVFGDPKTVAWLNLAKTASGMWFIRNVAHSPLQLWSIPSAFPVWVRLGPTTSSGLDVLAQLKAGALNEVWVPDAPILPDSVVTAWTAKPKPGAPAPAPAPPPVTPVSPTSPPKPAPAAPPPPQEATVLPHGEWIPLRTAAAALAVATYGVVAVFREEAALSGEGTTTLNPAPAPFTSVYMRLEDGTYARLSDKGAVSLGGEDEMGAAPITAQAFADFVEGAQPTRAFQVRIPTLDTPPTFATLAAVVKEVQGAQPPPLSGADLAASNAARAAVFAELPQAWADLGAGVSGLLIPGWGAFYSIPIEGKGFYLLLTKQGSSSYRSVFATTNEPKWYENHGNGKMPPAPPGEQFIRASQAAARLRAANRIASGGEWSKATPGAELSVLSPLQWVQATGTWTAFPIPGAVKATVQAPAPLPPPAKPPKPSTATTLAVARVAALVTDGSRILFARQGSGWGLPSVAPKPGENGDTAALRAVEAILGSLPHGIVPANIQMTAQPDDAHKAVGVTQVEVIVADAYALSQWAPQKAGTEHAWIDADELEFDGPGVARWVPRLDTVVGAPLKIGSDLTSLLALWSGKREEWLKHAKSAAGSGIFTEGVWNALNSGSVATAGLPFQGKYTQNPRRKPRRNPVADDLVMFQVFAVPQPPDEDGDPVPPKVFMEYRSKKTGKLLRLQLGGAMTVKTLDDQDVDVLVGTSDAPKALEPDAIILGGGIYRGGYKSILETEGIDGFKPILTAVLGLRNPNWEALQKAALLEMAGLPLQKVTPAAEQAAAVAQAAVAAKKPVQPWGSATLSKQQVTYVDQIAMALKEMLGDQPLTTSGAPAQPGTAAWTKITTLKQKIQAAIKGAKGPGHDWEEAGGRWLRLIAVARLIGLWPSVLDPGVGVVYRNISAALNLGPHASWGWSERGKAQAAELGITDFKDAARAWIKHQNEKQPKPPSHAAGMPKYNFTFGDVKVVPSWAGEPWANVEGFSFIYREYRWAGVGYAGTDYPYSPETRPKTVGHWSSNPNGYNGSAETRVRASTASPGFVLVPTRTLVGPDSKETSHEGESEVIFVDINDSGLPAEVVRAGGAEFSLNGLNAYQNARPPYPADKYLGSGDHAVALWLPGGPNAAGAAPKPNPARGDTVHAYLLSRAEFSPGDARAWAQRQGHAVSQVKLSEKWIWLVLQPANSFRPNSFRTETVAPGVRVVSGKR